MHYSEAEKFIIGKFQKELPANLHYHGLHHTLDVRDAVERIARMENMGEEEIVILKTTAMYHDAGFIYQYYDNEHLGVKLACDTLTSFGYSGVQITNVSKLILSTSLPYNPKNQLERIICDADLDYLGREDFYSISYTLRREWAEYGKAKTLLQWYEEQLAFMKKQKYFTRSANQLREARKQQYIAEMKEMLGKRKHKTIMEESMTALPADEKILTLKALSIFSGTSDEILSGIASMTKTLVVKSGQIIIQKGDIGKSMYIIHSGRVKVHDDIYTIAELGEGNFFGEVSLLDTEPRSASITAIADTTLFVLEQEDFYKILQKHKDVAQGIMKILIGRFRKQNATIFNDLKEKEKKLQALVDQRTQELQSANKEIEKAFHQIEEKNQKLEVAYKDIRDSISYAKRIQQAILPNISDVYRALTQSFVYYKPKDIVSGDFYFFAEKNNKIMLGVADCTGHGVPGAFMSMIGHDMLNQIIIEKGITSPSEVLNHLEAGIRGALKQDMESSENKDGMDIALCSLGIQSAECELQFAGAFRNLYLVRKGASEVEEVRADKNSIGGMLTGDTKRFSNHQIFLNKGDAFYIFSDGYCDQFGGPGGKKFMSRQFQKLFLSIRHLSMKEQEEVIDKTFRDWKGDLEQIDDVLVIGVRI
ncbi:MAG: cyclic nucleotide-binding domain-containing protein [Bacteroidetes bacterium]|nr:cyclic nucleotide-binding domain-containing protein [Bacteroidota bacterium]